MASDKKSDKSGKNKLYSDLFGEQADEAGKFDFQSRRLPEEEIQKASRLLRAHLYEDTAARPASKFLPSVYYKVAATVALLVVSTLAYFILQMGNAEVSYTTAFGDTQRITLPDNSTVLLNANSTLRYNSDWTARQIREVWLEGEAYFSVIHQDNHQKFLVHTQNLDVEVLGTQFNVNNRRGKTEVVLNSGKVKLNLDKSDKEEILMEPGELVAYSPKEQNYVRKLINSEAYTSWRNNLLIYENKPLREIANTLEDNYGFTIRFASPAIAEKRFTATIPADNVEVLFTMLSSTFEIEQRQKTIIIHKKTDSPF